MWDWFFEPFAESDWWEILNSGIVTTSISAVVGILVAQRVGLVALESRAAAQAKQDAEREESRLKDDLPSDNDGAAEGGAPDPGMSADRETFHRASTAIRRLKDYVDALADRVRDGRTRRKYNNIGRRDYRVITSAIEGDGGLSKSDFEKIMMGFESWRAFRNGRTAVPEETAKTLERLADRFRVTAHSPSRWRTAIKASGDPE